MREERTNQILPEIQLIFDSMSEAIILQDTHHRMLWVNRVVAEVVGITPEQLVGRRCYEVIHQRQKPCVGCPVEKAWETGKPEESESTAPDGRTWLIRAYPVRDDKKKVIGVVEVSLEITENKAKEEQYRTIIRTAMDGFWLGDAQGHLLDVNDSYCSLTGYSREELLNMSIQDIEAVEKPGEIAQRIQKIIRTGNDRFETRHKCKDGRIINVEVSTIYSNVRGGRFFVFIRDITERKKAEESLQENERNYRDLAESISDIFFAFDKDLRYTYWNKASEELTGISAKDALGKHLYDIFPDTEMTRKAEKVYQEALRTKCPQHFINEYQLGDKHYLFEISAYPSQKGLSVFARDITEHKQVEEELKLRAQILDGATDSIFLHDFDGNFIYVNEAACRTHGYSREEFMKMKLHQVIAPERVPGLDSDFKEMLEKGQVVFESAHLRKDGSVMPAEVHGRTIESNGRKLLLTVIRDITERKRAEEALRQAEAKYRSVVVNGVEGIFQATPEGRFVMANRALAQMHGYESPEEFVNTVTDIQRQLYVEPGDRIKLTKLLEKFSKVEAFEAQFYRKDGKKIWVSLNARVVRDAKGTVLYYEGTAEDITKRKEAEARLSKLYSMQTIEKIIAESLLRVRNEFELFQQVCDSLANLEFIKLAWIGIADKERRELKPVVHAGFEDGYLSVIKVTWDDSGHKGGPSGEAVTTGQSVVTPDVEKDPKYRRYVKEALKRGYLSRIVLPVIHEGEVIGVLSVYSGTKDAFRDDEVGLLTRVTNDLAVGVKTLRLQKDLERSLERTRNMLEGTIDAVAAMSETRDPYTAGHQRRVAKLASAIAEEIGLPKEQIEAIRVAGLLHDIGKVYVPAEILSKPGKLSEIEMSLVKAHSQASVDILKTIDFPWRICGFVLQHHERMDGSGYPNGLSGKDISLEGKILGVADVVEAMASHRPYRPALGVDRALEEISRNKGVLYDPEVVNACLRLFTKKGFKFD